MDLMSSLLRFLRSLAGRAYGSGRILDPAAERRRRAALAFLRLYRPPIPDPALPDFANITLPEIREALLRTSAESWPALLQLLRALAAASDRRGMYTRGHSDRVTRFSGEIARILGLPEDEVERIRVGGLIHDIGKIVIDEEILNKPTALTQAEYEIMKTHARHGYELLKGIPQLEEILPGLQFHHERLNGEGYPHGIAGDEIPMIARVITVADSFDAATTVRPYQEAPPPIESVLECIQSAAGVEYDESAVEALIHGVRRGRIVTRLEDRIPAKREAWPQA